MDAYLSNISDLGDIPEMLNIDFKNSLLLWVMVVHTFDFSTQEVEAGGSELDASLEYRVNSRIARATQRNTA